MEKLFFITQKGGINFGNTEESVEIIPPDDPEIQVEQEIEGIEPLLPTGFGPSYAPKRDYAPDTEVTKPVSRSFADGSVEPLIMPEGMGPVYIKK